MTTPHLNQIIELRDGRRAMVYRIQPLKWRKIAFRGLDKCGLNLVSVVTSTGEKSEVYL